ncbi:hypothetical protein [Phyllobacterium sp. 22552]|uniref:hypothetical protein n=1 Tax=Phyllobacterium sp. 22552 TaxID=3453941 RepID=UPI003F83082A
MRAGFLTFFVAVFVASPVSADRSCAEVNKFYENTRNVSRYQTTITHTPPGSTTRTFLVEARFNGLDRFERDANGNWSLHHRDLMVLDPDYPTFSNCARQPDETVNGQKIITYVGEWQRGRRRANIVFRTSADTGRAIDVTREMTLTDKGFPFDIKGAKTVETFTYDRSVPNPTSYR